MVTKQTYKTMETLYSGFVNPTPRVYLPKFPEAVSKPASMPNAAALVPSVAESSTTGDCFRDTTEAILA